MLPKIAMLGGLKMSREIKHSIASHRREMLEFARELVSIPTENPPGRAAEECGLKLDGRIALTFVADEETGGARGSQLLVDHGLIEKDAGMLTPEPTGVIWNASRGAVSLRATLRGKTAHVGLAHAGRNAFESMLTAAQELMKLKAKIGARKTRYSIRPAAARHSILLLGGQCHGGRSEE